jgi:hypothetical protein
MSKRRSKEAEATIAACTRDALVLVATRGTSTAADERFQRDAAETIEGLCEDIEYIVDEHENDLESRVDKCADYIERVLDPIDPNLFECALFLRDFATLMEGVRQWRDQEAYRRSRAAVKATQTKRRKATTRAR